ncbi:MAG: cation-transporting P-type ATPase, partial [Proteobacteria bacterium]|nr:cation-transporting P-type ATPase [Pseudomonadota bacterium]
LTENRLVVKKIWSKSQTNIIYSCAIYCNSLIIEKNIPKGDPLEVALFEFAKDYYQADVIKKSEIPFDSDRKIMTTVNRIGDKEYVFSKGAFENLFPLCTKIEIGNDNFLIDESEKHEIQNIYDKMTGEGLKVIALAYKNFSDDTAIEEDFIFLGFIGLYDPPRPEVYEAVKKCKSAGIKIIMITGDAGRTAEAIAREIGLTDANAKVIERREFLSLKDKDLLKILDSENLIFARMTPIDKLRIVTLLKDKKLRVAVTGDGVNDAPALKRADIGISMGIAGTDIAKESAGIVLLDDNFATIINAIEEGRAIFENIRNFVTYIFSSNIPEIIPYILYVMFRIPLPLTIMQILAVDLGTDLFPALALGSEKPSEEVMKKPPRKKEERLLNKGVLTRAYLILGPIEALCGLSGFFLVLYQGGWKYGEVLSFTDPLYITATTACLSGIVITQIANVFTCRSNTLSIFKLGFFSNRLILYGIFLEVLIALFIFYTDTGNRIFQTLSISPVIFLYQLPFAVMLLAVDEIRKALKNKML